MKPTTCFTRRVGRISAGGCARTGVICRSGGSLRSTPSIASARKGHPMPNLATDLARVMAGRSHNRSRFYSEKPESFWMMVMAGRKDECWLWTGAVKPDGYGRVRLDGRPMTSSRCAWFLSHGDPSDLYVLHKCHNRLCVNPSHLHLGTNDENMREMAVAGRAHRAIGEKNGNSKLSEQLVRSIRRDSRTNKELMAAYGIGSSTVSQIRSRKRWAHVED